MYSVRGSASCECTNSHAWLPRRCHLFLVRVFMTSPVLLISSIERKSSQDCSGFAIPYGRSSPFATFSGSGIHLERLINWYGMKSESRDVPTNYCGRELATGNDKAARGAPSRGTTRARVNTTWTDPDDEDRHCRWRITANHLALSPLHGVIFSASASFEVSLQPLAGTHRAHFTCSLFRQPICLGDDKVTVPMFEHVSVVGHIYANFIKLKNKFDIYKGKCLFLQGYWIHVCVCLWSLT